MRPILLQLFMNSWRAHFMENAELKTSEVIAAFFVAWRVCRLLCRIFPAPVLHRRLACHGKGYCIGENT
jgi:hypothetical protein